MHVKPLNWKTGRTVSGAILIGLAAWLLGQSTRATVIFQDDFNTPATGTPSALQWDTQNSPVNNSGGLVTIGSTGGTTVLESIAAFGHGEFRITLNSVTQPNAGIVFGLNSIANSPASGDAVWIRDDGANAVYLNGVGVGALGAASSPVAPAVYKITYLPNLLEVYRDATLLLSTTNPAQIPDEPLHFEFVVYDSHDSLVVDQVVFDDLTIPEPSTVMLLGVGGLLLFRRRRRVAK